MPKNSVETRILGNQVTYKRHFDVPVELAFEVWSTPRHLAHWWGPDGFTLTTTSMDFCPGGFWEFVMHGPDGRDYQNKVEFLEIRAPFFIRYMHRGKIAGDRDVEFEARVHFEELGNGTNLTFEQIFSSQEELERLNAKYGAVEGAKQHIENFRQYALNLSASRKEELHA